MTDRPFQLVTSCRPLRLALVGAGAMGQAWAKVIAQGADTQLASWIDTATGRAADAAAQAGLDGVLTTESLSHALDHDIDAVIDVTVPHAHREVTLEALGHGLPVLGEKPLAPTMAEAREMVTAAEQAGQLFMVSQSRRYEPGLARFLSAADTLLPLAILTSDFWLSPRFGGFREQMADPLLIDMAIHTFDAARLIARAEPISVWCETFNPSWSWYRGNASAVATFEMTDGLRYIYAGSWCAPGAPTSWNARWRATGECGTALWDGDERVALDRGDAAGPPPAGRNDDGAAYGLAGALAEFVIALRTGRTPMGECHDNLISLAMVHAAVTSARVDSRVRIEEILAA